MPGRPTTRNAAMAVLLASLACAPRGGLAADEIPLPVDRTQSLAVEGAVYYVEGRRRIPKGIELTVQKDVKIVGRGEGAVLEVEGALWIRGVKDREVRVQDLWIEPLPAMEELHTDMVKFSGTGGIRNPREAPTAGRVFLENTEFGRPTAIDLYACKEGVDVQRVTSSEPVRIRVPRPAEGPIPKVKLMVMNCSRTPGGLLGGLEVEDVDDVTVRGCHLGGPKVSFVNCGKVIFDANKVTCASLEFRHAEDGHFHQYKMQKCDVYAERIVLSCPLKGAKPQSFSTDKCWFQGETDEKVLREKLFHDHDDDPAQGARAEFKKINKRALELAGPVDR